MHIRELAPRLGERAIIAGQTGSGKTYLAREIMGFYRHVVVYDAKGLLRWPGFVRITKLRDLSKNHERMIYAPTPAELRHPNAAQRVAYWDAFFEWVYKRGNTTVYVDEAYSIMLPTGEAPHYYHACLTRGRELGVTLITSTQRPKSIDPALLSEAERYFVFRLQMPQDRERIEQTIGLERAAIAGLKKRFFWYADAAGDRIGPCTIKSSEVKT